MRLQRCNLVVTWCCIILFSVRFGSVCGKIFSESFTGVMLYQLDEQLLEMKRKEAAATWAMMIESPAAVGRLEFLGYQLSDNRTTWISNWCYRLKSVLVSSYLDNLAKRAIYLMCRGPRYTPNQARKLTETLGQLQRVYTEPRVCRGRDQPCYSGEPGLERLVSGSEDAAVLLWAWQSWREAVIPARSLYSALVTIQNEGARSNGYNDIGECWREELETPNLEDVADRLYAEVLPFFTMLHAFVRFKLSSVYGRDLVSLHKPIPAHLLGNLWSQNWDSLIGLLMPQENAKFNLNNRIKELNWTVNGMVKETEQFYVSMGLPTMTEKFWQHSQFEKEGTCHATAANMFQYDDFRILMCAKPTMEDFYVMHHEMGHIHYYMSYRDQPSIFQDGANSGLQEAIGDAIMLAVMSPPHLQRLRLIDHVDSTELELYLLLLQALNKIPQLGFGLAMEKWRWGTMNKKVKAFEYVSSWWSLRDQLQGVRPPTVRTEQHFDPAAKFHVTDNTPYIRYFLSGFLQMQILDALCEASGIQKQLHTCDIYSSSNAGNKLRQFMSTGNSLHWSYLLSDLTSGKTKSYSSKPLLDYYKPLIEWLHTQIKENQIPIGW